MAYTEDELEDDLKICEGAPSELDLDELDNTEMSMDSQGIVAINVLCTERILAAIHKSQYAENNPETKELMKEIEELKATNEKLRTILINKEEDNIILDDCCKKQQKTIEALHKTLDERRL